MVPMILQSGSKIKKALEASSSILQSVIAGDWQQSAGQPGPKEEQSEKDKGVVFSGDLQQTAAGPTANLVIREEEDKDYIGDYSQCILYYLVALTFNKSLLVSAFMFLELFWNCTPNAFDSPNSCRKSRYT